MGAQVRAWPRFLEDQGCTRARRVEDGSHSDGALCSSGLNELAVLERMRLSIVGGALASDRCERGDRGGTKAWSRRLENALDEREVPKDTRHLVP